MSCPGHYCAECDDARYEGDIGCKRCEGRLRAELQKAEAERDERKAGNLMFMSQIHAVLNRVDPGGPNDGILTRLIRTVDRLDSERARADRYMAAMTEFVASLDQPTTEPGLLITARWAQRDRQVEAIGTIRSFVEETKK